MHGPSLWTAPAATLDMASRALLRVARPAMIASALAVVVVLHAASARADDQPDRPPGDGSEPDHLAAFYRRVALPPYLERGVQTILEAEWEEAQGNAEKVGLRRMSRSHYRRALVALDRSTDARIRALIGPRRFLAWNRARMDPMRNRAGRAALAARMRVSGRPTPPPATHAVWTRDQCAGLGRLLRGPALGNTTIEEAHFWIHDLARHC